ncbi:MAG: hypothetical protein QW331_04410 [Candidatus Woesearchaeota archaeon]
MKAKILNSKEVKLFLKDIEDQFGTVFPKDHVYLMNNQNDVFITTRELEKINTTKLRVNSIGLYIAEWHNGARLSIEGSQIVGSNAKKRVVELSNEEAIAWLKGEDIYREVEKGVLIVKHKDDFLGCARSTGERLVNHVPKTRRVKL